MSQDQSNEPLSWCCGKQYTLHYGFILEATSLNNDKRSKQQRYINIHKSVTSPKICLCLPTSEVSSQLLHKIDNSQLIININLEFIGWQHVRDLIFLWWDCT